MNGTNKRTESYVLRFDINRGLSQSEENKCFWTQSKPKDTTPRGSIFTVDSYTFILLWFRNSSVSVDRYQLSFLVFIFAFRLESSSFFRQEFNIFILNSCDIQK